ncbi:hypothetical protein BaRGS_00040545, partial [Batillaria attramentaria]
MYIVREGLCCSRCRVGVGRGRSAEYRNTEVRLHEERRIDSSSIGDEKVRTGKGNADLTEYSRSASRIQAVPVMLKTQEQLSKCSTDYWLIQILINYKLFDSRRRLDSYPGYKSPAFPLPPPPYSPWRISDCME